MIKLIGEEDICKFKCLIFDNNEIYNKYKNINNSYLCSNPLDLLKIKYNHDNIGIVSNNINYKYLLEFIIYYQKTKNIYEKKVTEYNNSFITSNDNNIIKDATEKLISMNSGGKFIRSILIDLGYRLSKNDDYAYPLGVAYETFQTSILIHDDIIDNAVLRRGKKTIPVRYNDEFKLKNKEIKECSDSMGICIGDLGFYLANKIIIDNYKNDKNFGLLFSYYNDIVIKTIKGEVLDVIIPIKAKYFNYKTSYNDVNEIYHLKTSWYTIIGPFCLGLILGDNYKNIDTFYEILNNIGIAFQIKDDLIGIFEDNTTIGKNGSSDINEFKQTILYSYTINTSYKDELLRYYGKKQLTKNDIKIVRNIFETSGALKYATDTMNSLFDKSKKALKNININEEYKNILYGLIIYLENRYK